MQIAFPSGMFAGKGLPRTAPISALYPTQAIFDLDATLSASYNGSGQVWHNTVAAPGDGSAQSAYDFNYGATSGSSTDDPTFNGTPGDPAAFISFDGGDYFSLAGSIPSFFNTIHNGTDPHTLIIAMNAPTDAGSGWGLFGTTNVGSSSNVGINYNSGFNAVFSDQRVLATDVAVSRGGLFPASAPMLMIISYDPVTHFMNIWNNNLTVKSTGGNTYTVTASNQIGPAPAIFANAGGGSKAPSGSKIYGISLLKKAATATDAIQIAKFYNKRHNRTYVAA